MNGVLPPWLDTQDVAARTGTTRVRAVERFWICGRNRQTGDMEVWGQGVKGTWEPITVLMGANGRPVQRPETGDWDRFLIAQTEARRAYERYGETTPDRVERHNRALRESQSRADRETAMEKTKYVHRAFAQAVDGSLRYGARDVFQGLKSAEEGSGKAYPQGLVVSLPGGEG